MAAGTTNMAPIKPVLLSRSFWVELEKKFEDLSGSTRKKVKQIKKYFKFTLTPGTPTLPERAPPNDYRMHALDIRPDNFAFNYIRYNGNGKPDSGIQWSKCRI